MRGLVLLVAGLAARCAPALGKLVSQSVQCDPSQMHVFFDFDEDFRGIIYSKEFFAKPGCQVYGDGGRKASISFPLNIDAAQEGFCGVRLEPSSHVFDVVVRVNEDTTILVDGMKEFSVRCKYRLEAVTLQLPSLGGLLIEDDQEGQNQDLVPQAIIQGSGSGLVPILDMTMRRGDGIFGTPVQSAAIGEEITMDVFLHDPVPYDIFVYNCIAHEGSRLPGGTVTLIDSRGCGVFLDRVTLPPVQSTVDDQGIKHVHIRLRGFQFSTSETVYFECQVKPCLHKCNVSQCQDGPAAPSLDSPVLGNEAGLGLGGGLGGELGGGLGGLGSEAPELPPSERLQGTTELEAAPSLSLQASLAMRFADPATGEAGSPALLRDEGREPRLCLAPATAAALGTMFAVAVGVAAAALVFLTHRLRRDDKEFPLDSSQTSTL